MKNRALKVDFASDNKNGNNLKKEDILFRDTAEVVKASQASQNDGPLSGEILGPSNSTTEEMLENLSDDQE